MSPTTPRTGFVIVAAGSGTRLGAGIPKAFVTLGERTLLEHALRGLGGFPGRISIAVAAPATHLDEARTIARTVARDWVDGADADGTAKVPGGVGATQRPDADCAADVPDDAGSARATDADAPAEQTTITVVAGGASRQSSVAAALASLPDDCDVILVHDAARALAPRSLTERVAGAVRATGDGVVPVLPVTDTIKRVSDGRVVDTVDRDTLGAAQTPQGFPATALREAYASATVEFTDDAALAAAAGLAVRTVEGDEGAFKVTRPDDLVRAQRRDAEAAQTAETAEPATTAEPSATPPSANATPDIRVGIGTDVHAFDDDAELWLAGLHWPGEPGLAGHSDGDAVCHAIVDAVLSAAGLGDIGEMFGTDDPALDGARGEVFVRRARARVEEAGFRIRNVAVQLVAQRPRFSPRRDEARAALEDMLGAPVSVSATTSDGLGFTGRREGVLAIATALVEARPDGGAAPQ